MALNLFITSVKCEYDVPSVGKCICFVSYEGIKCFGAEDDVKRIIESIRTELSDGKIEYE